MATAEQWDFGAGIYRGREAPENAAYDLLNCLLDDEGQPFRRGGSVYRSTSSAGASIVGMADVSVAAGRRTIIATASQIGVVSDAGVVSMHSVSPNTIQSFTRWPVMPSGYAVIPALSSASGAAFLYIYGGASKVAYATGTMSLTQDSDTVTGAGTSWVANADPGHILVLSGLAHPVGQDFPVVKSILSNTSLTLTKPWTQAAAPARPYSMEPVHLITLPVAGVPGPIYATTAARRLLVGFGTQVFFSPPDDGQELPSVREDYHDIPAGTIIGLEGVGDRAYVFTTAGTFAINNLYFDALDDVGNVQHTVSQINELVLWGDAGVAQWRGAVVAPCVDDVWLLTSDAAPVPIGGGVKPLYLSYAKAGYQPGIASIHRGHYFLPILNGSTLVDVLTCRLDRQMAWTRWSGHGAGVAYAQRIGDTTRTPKLFAVNGQRVLDLTSAWSPSSANATEADGTTHTLTIETRDLPTPGGAAGSTTRKVKVRYQATGTAAFTVSYARGPEDATYTSLGTATRGGSTSDGLDESVWPVNKRAPAIRFRITSTSALSTFTLRGLEAHYTPRGQ